MAIPKATAMSRDTRPSPGAPERRNKNIRSKEGCLTCRIRRKKCDQGKTADSCESCRRLHIECLGYSRNRPEWLKGAQVEEFKKTIKRFLAENSPKSGNHSRQDTTVPVPFLSFEGLRNRSSVKSTLTTAGPSSIELDALPDTSNIDEIEDSGSDEDTPRHFQLLPLNKKEPAILFKSPEPILNGGPSDKPEDVDMTADEESDARGSAPVGERITNNNEIRSGKQRVESPAVDHGAIATSPDDPAVLYYMNVIFPVLHELAGFNLSPRDLLTIARRETVVRTVMVTQAQHHQNRIKFLTSTDGPHHQSTQKICLELAASNSAYVNALTALSPMFDHATRHNDIDTLAVLYTFLHFGGIGELLTRHIARRSQGSSSGSSFILELSCRWLASTIAHFSDLASALRRSTDRQRALIQAAIHIDIYSSIALCRPPHFLDHYRTSFKHTDAHTSKDSNGVRVAVQPRLDDLLDIPARTTLALAEMSAMASWKAEHVRHGSLSIMDLSRWAKRIDALLAPPTAESLLGAGPQHSSVTGTQVQPAIVTPPPPGTAQSKTYSVSSDRPGLTAVISSVSPSRAGASNPVSSCSVKGAVEAGGPMARSNIASVPGAMGASTETSNPGGDAPAAGSASIDVSNEAVAGSRTCSEATAIDRETSVPVATQAIPVSRVSPVASVLPKAPLRPFKRTLPPATREVFRCAGRVFLHTIISGEHPRVHDIVRAVADTCDALRDLGLSYLPSTVKPTPSDDLRFPVVRGLPFCIFIAGSVAGSVDQAMFLRSCLRPVIREIDMQTAELLTAVLSERAGSGDANWQAVMNKRGSRLVFM